MFVNAKGNILKELRSQVRTVLFSRINLSAPSELALELDCKEYVLFKQL